VYGCGQGKVDGLVVGPECNQASQCPGLHLGIDSVMSSAGREERTLQVVSGAIVTISLLQAHMARVEAYNLLDAHQYWSCVTASVHSQILHSDSIRWTAEEQKILGEILLTDDWLLCATEWAL
jgi:hypothetical protein